MIIQPSFSINTNTDAMDGFFRDFIDPQTGWINVTGLDFADITKLRTLAKGIMGREILCGYPKATLEEQPPEGRMMTVPPDGDRLEYCFWASDIVSAEALANFSFEKSLWEWVVHMFDNKNLHDYYDTTNNNDHSVNTICPPLGFLDIGVNVGDWISPN